MPFIQTFSGGSFRPLDPDFSAIRIEDIAHALSNICRFGGHCERFYSVAQHSLIVARNVPAVSVEGCPLALWALLHDAAEAYIGDMVRPLKQRLVAVADAEENLAMAVRRRFDIPTVQTLDPNDYVGKADLRALATERRDLLKPTGVDWPCLQGVEPFEEVIGTTLSPAAAESAFIARFDELVHMRYRA